MNKIQKIKKFVTNYAPEIVYGTLVTGIVLLTGYVIVASIKEVNATNEWIQEQYAAGNVVHQLIDGSFISVKYTAND